jgi:hypothetical protein
MDPTLSAQLFFLGGQDGQRGLTDFDYNSNSRTPGGWAQAVQVSAFPDRYDDRYAEAEQIYNRLKDSGDDDMFTEDDRNLLRQISAIRRPSLSPLRWPNEGDINTCAGFAWTSDANIHVVLVEKLAVDYGDPVSIALLGAVANTTEPGREEDAKLAARILAKVKAGYKAVAEKQAEEWLAAEKANT